MNGILAVVWSPFQLMCLQAALCRLGRTDCDVVILRDELSNRTGQIEMMAHSYGYSYQVIEKKLVSKGCRSLLTSFAFSLLPWGRKQYDYLFIGDYRFYSVIGSFFTFLKRGSRICFLEDGNISIMILNGRYRDGRAEKYYRILNRLCGFRKISMDEYYTIYSDIKSDVFKLVDISSFLRMKDDQRLSGVYFIGTNTSVYCGLFKMDVSAFLDRLKTVLLELKRKYGDNVVYIPHGRETNKEIAALCKEIDVEYKPLDVCVEAYFQEHNIVPQVLYGFSSSALMSMRCYSPDTEIYNCVNDIVLGNDTYRLISDYYESHGINRCEI